MESGGRADKFGNEFEKLWVIDQVLSLLDDNVCSVVWEPSGVEGDGVDLQVERSDGWEAHQVKRSNRSEGKWTVGELGARRVLEASYRHLTSGGATRFVFVSRDSAVLRELAERAEHWDGKSGGTFFRTLPTDLTGPFKT